MPFRSFVARGYEVHAVTSGTGGFPWESADKVIAHSCDLLDPSEQRRLIEAVRPSHLLHFAWYTAHGKFWTAPENVKWVAASLRFSIISFPAGVSASFSREPAPSTSGRTRCSRKRRQPLHPATLYGICKNSLQSIFSAATAECGYQLRVGQDFFSVRSF